MLNERNIPLEEDGIEEEIFVEEELTITKAMWGDIGGNIANQTDLQNALDAKQDSLTEAQINAVNSGITAGKVETYDGYADQIASKADQSALNAESTARDEADTALGTRIDNEALARQSADNGLQTQIDAITSKSDVVDVVANYAALQAYDTSTLGNNDVVKVLDDETHEDALTYYRWSTTTQTWTYIGQEAPYYSKGQMDVMLQGKQDTLNAGANIQIENGTISATDTTYAAGNGLNLNGTEFSADTDVLATKEDLEGYYTKPETDNLLAPKLEAEVVAELPATGEEGKLYLTPKAHTTQTATGNPITASVTEQAGAIESFQLDGDTLQNGTPTPEEPVPIQTVTGLQTISINGTDYPLDLGDIELCGLGDDGNGNPLYKDRIYRDGENWKVHKAIYGFTLNGDETWRNDYGSVGSNYRHNFMLADNNMPKGVARSNLAFVSSHFIGHGSPWDSDTWGKFYISDTWVILNDSGGKYTLAQLKTWLATALPRFNYAIETPTDITITDQTLIAQLEAIRTAALETGTNTITNAATGTNLAGDMEISYYGFNPRNRYDKWLWLDINNEYEQIGS